MLRVVVLRVLLFVDMRLPRIQCVADLYWFEVVFTLLIRSINTIPEVTIDYLTWFGWPPRTL